MAQPTTREEFKQWCLRKLGKPVIEINVDDDQVEDRIDESIAFYRDYHYDATEYTFLKHQITANDISNQYISVNNSIIGISDIFDIGDSTLSVNNMFNARYQMALNGMFDLTGYDMANYTMVMTHINFIEEMLVGKQPIRYNRHVNRLYIDMDWDKVKVGHYIVAKVFQVLDPDTYTDVWSDRWLQNYATAKIKYQWGLNLSKFEGMQLPGGVQFNGREILQEAKEDLTILEEELRDSYTMPAFDMIG